MINFLPASFLHFSLMIIIRFKWMVKRDYRKFLFWLKVFTIKTFETLLNLFFGQLSLITILKPFNIVWVISCVKDQEIFENEIVFWSKCRGVEFLNIFKLINFINYKNLYPLHMARVSFCFFLRLDTKDNLKVNCWTNYTAVASSAL